LNTTHQMVVSLGLRNKHSFSMLSDPSPILSVFLTAEVSGTWTKATYPQTQPGGGALL